MKSKEKKVSKLRELQLSEFEIMKYFISICEKEGLTYYISGGTFLGAVKYKGFIPWDDDVDIAMPRSDYEKFLKIASKYPKFKLKNYHTDKEYVLLPSRLVNENIKVVSKAMTEEQIWDAWIDIFPLDGLPNNFILRQIYKLRIQEKKLLVKLSSFKKVVNVTEKRKSIIERFFVWLAKHIDFESRLDTHKRIQMLDEVLKKQSLKKSRYYMNFYGAYKFKSILRKDVYYLEGANYTFEGITVFGPKNYDLYLSHFYGEYMKTPKDLNKNKHETEIIGDDKE